MLRGVLLAILATVIGTLCSAHPSSLACYPDAKSNRMHVGAKIMGYPVNAWFAGPSVSVHRSLPGQQIQDEYVPGEPIDITIGGLNQSNSSAPTFVAVRVSDTATGVGFGEFVTLSAGMNWTAAAAATSRTSRSVELVKAVAGGRQAADADADADGWKCPFQFFAVTLDAGVPPNHATGSWVAPCSAGTAGASITITVLYGAGAYGPGAPQPPPGVGFVGYVNATTKVLKRSAAYDCARSLDDDFGLAWKLDTQKSSLSTMLTYSGDPTGTAWLGWGLSDRAGGMIASTNATVNTAVIANASSDGKGTREIRAYELLGKTPALVVQAVNYTKLINPASGFENNVSYFSFQQRTDNMAPRYNSFGATSHIIFGAGKPNTSAIGKHKVQNSTTITWSPAAPTAPPTPPPSPPAPPTTPSACTCCASWCTQSGALQPDGAASSTVATEWTLSWRVSEVHGSIDFAVEINAAAWVGFGIPSSGMSMIGAYAVLCKPGGAEMAVGEFVLDGYDPSVFKALTPELLSADLTQQTPESGPARTICQFRRNMTTATPNSQNFSAANSFIIAAGSGNAFQKHAAYFHDAKVGHIDWRTGSAMAGGGASLTDFQQSVVHHAILMVLAWGLLIPTGVLSAKFRGADPIWFKIHRAANMLGLVVGFVGLGIIVTAYNTSSRKHFVVLHAKIGLAVMVICGFQPLNALARPSKNKGDIPSLGRLVWELCHKGSGYGAVILAWVNIFLAADLPVMQDDALSKTKDTAETVFYLLLGGLCCAAVLTSLRRWQATDTSTTRKDYSDGITGSTSLYEGT